MVPAPERPNGAQLNPTVSRFPGLLPGLTLPSVLQQNTGIKIQSQQYAAPKGCLPNYGRRLFNPLLKIPGLSWTSLFGSPPGDQSPFLGSAGPRGPVH